MEPLKESEPETNYRFGNIVLMWITITIIMSIVVITLAVLAYLAYIESYRGVVQATNKVFEIPEKFKTGTITHTFIESITDISPTHGDVLELATSHSHESFKRTDSRRILFDSINLGTTESSIRVPVTFRYHIRLSDKWILVTKNNVCKVLAPLIHPSLPPAIHTDQMEKNTESGWARFDKGDNLSELERSITPELNKRAGDLKHMKLVREACRQSVANFVRRWLIKEDHWRNDRFSSIVVVFPDEATINSDQELEQYHDEPTVKFE